MKTKIKLKSRETEVSRFLVLEFHTFCIKTFLYSPLKTFENPFENICRIKIF